ncbi:hypothetical protein M885DRAFT_559919 [Pelagophyceae sp. CCMP2097]|nr:hypothetical protein M885DRAFT_559919 [Pelagophyceae sp. CCMP2097]
MNSWPPHRVSPDFDDPRSLEEEVDEVIVDKQTGRMRPHHEASSYLAPDRPEVDEELDEEVDAVIAQKQTHTGTYIGRSKKFRTGDDPSDRIEAVARAALQVRQAMEGEIARLRRENDAIQQRQCAQAPPLRAPAADEWRSRPQPPPAEVERDFEITSRGLDAEIRRLKRENALLRGDSANRDDSIAAAQLETDAELEDLRRANLALVKRVAGLRGSADDADRADAADRAPVAHHGRLRPVHHDPRHASDDLFKAPRVEQPKFFAHAGMETGILTLAAALDLFPARLRHGGFLWKVPFHAASGLGGPAMPQRRWFRLALRAAPTVQAHGESVEVVLTWCASAAAAMGSGVLGAAESALPLEDVLELHGGHTTPAWWVQAAAKRTLPLPGLCLSLATRERTLDLACEDESDAKAWKRGLRAVVALLRHRRTSRFETPDDDAPRGKALRECDEVSEASDSDHSDDVSTLRSARSRHSSASSSTASTNQRGRKRLPSKSPRHADRKTLASPGARAAAATAALISAVEAGDVSGARALLEASAANGTDAVVANCVIQRADSAVRFEAPLHVASRRAQPRMVQLLLVHHADARARDARGRTPAHVAVRAADGAETAAVNCLAMLLDAAGDDVLEARDDAGDAPLHVAARAGAIECARLLLQTAADPSARNYRGETPQDAAGSDAAISDLISSYAADAPGIDLTPRRPARADADEAASESVEDEFYTPFGTAWGRRFCADEAADYYENLTTGHTQWDDPRPPVTHQGLFPDEAPDLDEAPGPAEAPGLFPAVATPDTAWGAAAFDADSEDDESLPRVARAAVARAAAVAGRTPTRRALRPLPMPWAEGIWVQPPDSTPRAATPRATPRALDALRTPSSCKTTTTTSSTKTPRTCSSRKALAPLTNTQPVPAAKLLASPLRHRGNASG